MLRFHAADRYAATRPQHQLLGADGSVDVRAEMIRLNAQARSRQEEGIARASRNLSLGVLHWLCPSLARDAEIPAPADYYGQSLARLSRLDRALTGPIEWDADPAGEQSRGTFKVDGTSFRFEIAYHQIGSRSLAVAPWDVSQTRRILWIGLAEESRS
jgi:hypothetical protein